MTDWDHRQLCPDGSCVGLIGPDGTCKVCGRAAPNWGEERQRGLLVEPDADAEAAPPPGSEVDDDLDEDEDEAPDDATIDDSAQADDEDEWATRRLCPDDKCVGVVGPEGTCNVCGRAAF